MAKLTDLQLLLLTTAAGRADGSLLPPPDAVAAFAAKVRRAIVPLIKQAFVVEMDGADDDQLWQEEGGRRVRIVVTDAGRAAAGIAPAPVVEVKPGTKTDTLLALLTRPGGATLAELAAATGWLPHTTRAALTRLRQKGHAVTRMSRDGASIYAVAA